MKITFIVFFLLIVYSCSESQNQSIENDTSILSQNQITQWIEAKDDKEKTILVQKFLENKHILFKQDKDPALAEMVIPILEVERIYKTNDYLAVLIGNLNDWHVTFMLLKSNGDRFDILYNQEINSHYRSPKIKHMSESFFSIEHEISGGTDLLEEQLSIFYLDTVEQKNVSVLNIPQSQSTGGYLKHKITPSLNFDGSNLKVQMNYKFWICDPIIGDPLISFETVEDSYNNFDFIHCEENDSKVLVNDSSQFSFKWNQLDKNFEISDGQKSLWLLFENIHDVSDFNCKVYNVLEKTIREYNSENPLIIERLITLCK